jgi:hypothetical protein
MGECAFITDVYLKCVLLSFSLTCRIDPNNFGKKSERSSAHAYSGRLSPRESNTTGSVSLLWPSVQNGHLRDKIKRLTLSCHLLALQLCNVGLQVFTWPALSEVKLSAGLSGGEMSPTAFILASLSLQLISAQSQRSHSITENSRFGNGFENMKK